MFSRFRASVITSTGTKAPSEFGLNSSNYTDQDTEEFSQPLEDSDDDYDDLILQPSRAVFVPPTHQRVVSCDDIWARTSRSPQRSLTERIYEGCHRPLSTSPSTSPNRHSQMSPTKESADFMATLTGDKDNVIKIQEKPGKLDSWFKGSSEPVTLGIPIKECEQEIVASSGTPSRSPNKLQRKSTAISSKSLQASTSRFSFFNTFPKPSSPLPPPGDDMMSLDIQAALAPAASPESFNATSFKTLLDSAESVLTKMQVAYKDRAVSLRELQAEKEAQDDEMEEANTRADHLKMQLADMAEKYAEQEKTMKELAEELAKERQLRRAEEEARKRSIALVKAPPGISASSRRNGRDSGIGMASDSGFESGDESASESLFPGSRDGAVSPTGTVLSYATEGSAPESFQCSDISIKSAPYSQAIAQTIRPFHISTVRPPNTKRPSTFQKVLTDIAKDDASVTEDSSASCKICQGATPAVGELRKENAGLKDRIVGLETALDGCLDLVGHL